MSPFIPRMHLFEIDDQTWFPDFFRKIVQDALTLTWKNKHPPLQKQSPARLAAEILIDQLGDKSLSSHTYIDFCAGGGGPTPDIERSVNGYLRKKEEQAVRFVLSDLHPNESAWRQAAEKSPQLGYIALPVDASRVEADLIKSYETDGKRVMRLFNLAFHHFDDNLARAILKNTVENSNGFVIFELQDRSIASFITCLMLGIGILISAPYYAWKWRSPTSLLFTYIIPIIPFVLVFDGFVSSLRTRTPDEVEALLMSCGTDASNWEVRSGRTRHLWPTGYLNWVICAKKGTLKEQVG